MFEISEFGKFLSGGAGIVQLMDDLGSAGEHEQPVCMLGGGNPGRIDEVEAYFREAMQALVDDPGRLDHMLGSYDSPEGDGAFRDGLAALLGAGGGRNAQLQLLDLPAQCL